MEKKIDIGYIDLAGLTIPVRVLELEKHYGRIDALIEPIGGAGQKWVNYDKIKTEKI